MILAYAKFTGISLKRKFIFTHLTHIQISNISPNTLVPSIPAQ